MTYYNTNDLSTETASVIAAAIGDIYLEYYNADSSDTVKNKKGLFTDLMALLKPEITLSDQDISSANATTDLTVYEPGGASALQDGAIVNVTWSGGDTTYYHKFTVTSSWTFYALGGPDLAPGDASATFAWCGYGDGALKLKLDIDNERWIVLGGIGGGGCFDKGGAISGGEWEQHTNKKLIVREIDGTAYTTSGASGSIYASANVTLTYVMTFSAAPFIMPKCKQTSGSSWAITRESDGHTTTQIVMRIVGGANTYEGYPGYEAIGEWRT